jgi:hypothetical protein
MVDRFLQNVHAIFTEKINIFALLKSHSLTPVVANEDNALPSTVFS